MFYLGEKKEEDVIPEHRALSDFPHTKGKMSVLTGLSKKKNSMKFHKSSE